MFMLWKGWGKFMRGGGLGEFFQLQRERIGFRGFVLVI